MQALCSSREIGTKPALVSNFRYCVLAVCSVDKSRSSTGSCCKKKSRCCSCPCGVDTFTSYGLISVDTSRCSSSPCGVDTSRCSTCHYSVDKSRSIIGICSVDKSRSIAASFCPNRSRFRSGPCGVDTTRCETGLCSEGRQVQEQHRLLKSIGTPRRSSGPCSVDTPRSSKGPVVQTLPSKAQANVM
jgi:hypothetical protein